MWLGHGAVLPEFRFLPCYLTCTLVRMADKKLFLGLIVVKYTIQSSGKFMLF